MGKTKNTFGTLQKRSLSNDVVSNMNPVMARLEEAVQHGYMVFPSSDAAKLRYDSIADCIKGAKSALCDLPDFELGLGEIGYHPMRMHLPRKNGGNPGKIIQFDIENEGGDFDTGRLENLGYNRYGIVMTQEPKLPSYALIAHIKTGVSALSKMKLYDGTLFPGGGELGPGFNTSLGEGNQTPQENFDFVSKLIDACLEVHVNPNLFGASNNYQVYQVRNNFVAYDPTYGEGTYVSPRFDDFFNKSKFELRKLDDVAFVPRRPGFNWQARIFQILGSN